MTADVIFYLLALLTIVPAFWVVLSPNIVHAGFALLFTLFGAAGLSLGEHRRMFDDPQLRRGRRVAGVGEFTHRLPGGLVGALAEVADNQAAAHRAYRRIRTFSCDVRSS